jgi:hypothetical protein
MVSIRPGANYVAPGKKGSKDTILYNLRPFFLSPWPKNVFPPPFQKNFPKIPSFSLSPKNVYPLASLPQTMSVWQVVVATSGE